MTAEDAKKRIKVLKKEINYHRYLYHVLDRQEISDAALDSLKYELTEIEKDFPEFITSDSPTQRIGGRPLSKFKKVKHRVPMLSLNDAFSIEEMHQWRERIEKIVPNFEKEIKKHGYFVELKIDGFAIELIYKNGILKLGATRGDGIIGEDVTQNIKTIEAIPLRLNFDSKFSRKFPISNFQFLKQIEIRGEVFMTKKVFKKVNEEQKKKNLSLYANPRNLAAGSIRQLDPKLAASRDLSFLAYDIAVNLGQKLHNDGHKILDKFSFKTDKYAKVCKDLKGVLDFWKYVQKIREKLSCQIDGIVVSVNSSELFKRLGVIGKSPRGAIAFKFPAEQATTIIENIKIQIGRTGALTPVAHLKPVSIGGTTVSRATLHNEDEIKRKDIRIGDTVIVQRAGDVIPEVVEVLLGLRPKNTKKFHMPKVCPICGARVARKEGDVIHYCSNKRCFAQKKRQIIHFVSKKAFDISGFGKKIVQQLINEGLVANEADIFKLKKGDFILLERFAEKSASKLIAAIQRSKEIALPKFLFSLGIRHVGEETAHDINVRFSNRGKIKDPNDLLKIASTIKFEDWNKMENIGPILAKSIFNWFNDKKNKSLLLRLTKSGIIIKSQGILKKTKKLLNKKFVFTGELKSLNRDEAKDLVRLLGGEVSLSVSNETDFVVVGESPGSKYDKAKKIGVKIITEKEFKKLVKKK